MNKETKTLSQQICELCRLEYERIQPTDDNGYDFITLRLDFENPENFVKLYELQTDDGTLAELIDENYYFKDRKAFLTSVIDFIQTWELSDEIKQAIRDYDGWVWG